MKFDIKKVINSSLIIGSLLLSMGAQALPTLELTFEGNPFVENRYQNVNLTLDDHQVNLRVSAGMFTGEAGDDGNFDAKTLFEDEKNVLAYCVDILNNLNLSTTYEVNRITEDLIHSEDEVTRNFGRMLDFLGSLNVVLGGDSYLGSASDQNWLQPNTGWMSAAIQVGIWESLYETDENLAVNEGNFRVNDLHNSGSNLLSSTFTDMGDNSALPAAQVRWVSTANGQDLVIDPVPVPSPTPLALLLSGLGLLFLKHRRRQLF